MYLRQVLADSLFFFLNQCTLIVEFSQQRETDLCSYLVFRTVRIKPLILKKKNRGQLCLKEKIQTGYQAYGQSTRWIRWTGGSEGEKEGGGGGEEP